MKIKVLALDFKGGSIMSKLTYPLMGTINPYPKFPREKKEKENNTKQEELAKLKRKWKHAKRLDPTLGNFQSFLKEINYK